LHFLTFNHARFCQSLLASAFATKHSLTLYSFLLPFRTIQFNQVRACNVKGCGAFSVVVRLLSPPSMPSSLTARYSDVSRAATLSWVGVDGADFYDVEQTRRSGVGSASRLATFSFVLLLR
jgi:hypothetical protein